MKDNDPPDVGTLKRDLEDANREIAWLRQSIYGSERMSKLKEEIEVLQREKRGLSIETRHQKLEIEKLKEICNDLEAEVETLKSRLIRAVDKISDLDGELESITTKDMP